MSKLVQRLSLHPSRYAKEVEEHFVARHFECPTCCGRGYTGCIAHDDPRVTCTRCRGTGEIQAHITVRWRSDDGSDGSQP